MNPGDVHILAVDQQPIHLLQQWADFGVNCLVGIGQGEDKAAWVAEANRLHFLQIREPVGDPCEDAASPLLLAWAHEDEPDLKGISAAKLAANRAAVAAAATVRPVPWFLNLAGGLVLGLVKPSAVPIAEPDYPALMAQAELISADVYPVAGWNLQPPVDLCTPACLVRKLRKMAPGKKVFGYLEASRQGLPWLPSGGRCVTPSEFKVQAHTLRKAGARGIILFPEQPQGGFQWDASPAEIKTEIIDLAADMEREAMDLNEYR